MKIQKKNLKMKTVLILILLENVCSSSISITGIQNSATGERTTIGEIGSDTTDGDPIATWYVVFDFRSRAHWNIRYSNKQTASGMIALMEIVFASLIYMKEKVIFVDHREVTLVLASFSVTVTHYWIIISVLPIQSQTERMVTIFITSSQRKRRVLRQTQKY